MRIISGKLGGRRFNVPDLPELRPSNDRLREGLFSSLDSMIAFEGCSVLDLFAGSGSLGLEAISRGAASCVFIEQGKKTAQALIENIKILGVSDQCRVVQGSYPQVLERINTTPFNLVFADPPYDRDSAALPAELLSSRIVSSGSLLIFENRKKSPELSHPALEPLREKIYGDSVVRVYKFQ